jgi:hypothetical protein
MSTTPRSRAVSESLPLPSIVEEEARASAAEEGGRRDGRGMSKSRTRLISVIT